MADPNENIRNGKKDLKEISDIVGVLDEGFQSLTSRLTDLAEGLTDIVNDARAFSRIQKDTISTLNKLAKANEKLIKNQIDLNNGQLSSKKINEQINEITATREILEQRLKNLTDKQIQGLILTQSELDEIQKLQEGIAEVTGEVADNYQRQLSFAKEIEKKAGGFQKLAGVVKSIPGLKGIAGPFQDAADAAAKAAASGKSSFQIFKAGAGGLASFLKGPIWITALVAAAKFFIEAMFAADKRVTDLAKNISISKDSARALYESFQQSKGILDSQLATTKNITEAFNELANISDFINVSNTKQLDTQIQLTKEIGIQVEEALQLQQLFAVNNNEADKGLDIVYDQIAAFANQNKIVADGRKIISDVNKLSGLIKLNFRGNTGEIVKTVLEAKKLGLTLDQITKTQSSLLDFESSISSQIEAELLTGRQINLERARLFALNNDIAGLTEEIAKQNITAASFSRMNALQQESIAKTLGMSANELGDSLFKQELINKTAGDYTKNLRENAKILRDQGKLEEANRLERQAEAVEQGIVEGKSLEQAQKSLDAQTKFNNALEHAQEIFTDLVDGGFLDKLSDTKSSTDAKLKQRLDDLRLLFKNSGIGENKLADRASASISSLAREQGLKVDDFVIKTHPKDTLVMAGGTKLGNNDETLKAQQETNILLRQLLTKNTNIYMDSNKVSTTISQNSFNVGQ